MKFPTADCTTVGQSVKWSSRKKEKKNIHTLPGSGDAPPTSLSSLDSKTKTKQIKRHSNISRYFSYRYLNCLKILPYVRVPHANYPAHPLFFWNFWGQWTLHGGVFMPPNPHWLSLTRTHLRIHETTTQKPRKRSAMTYLNIGAVTSLGTSAQPIAADFVFSLQGLSM